MRNFYKMKTSGVRRLTGCVLAVVALLVTGSGMAQAQTHGTDSAVPKQLAATPPHASDGQNYTVSGKVTDANGAGVAGATVIVKGDNTRGATTNADGSYTLNVKSSNDVLIVSYLGKATQEMPVNGRSTVDVQMKDDNTMLDQVVAIGYGTQKRQFIIGAVSSITSKELTTAPATRVSDMLSGKLPGLTAIQQSGQPGADGAKLYVRGNSAAPLCIVDGVPRNLDNINPDDIESISVLKDAATAAIYGVQGANGVILITTKGGKEGPATISYDGSVTFTTNTAMPEMLNAEDYMGWHNKAMEMDGQAGIMETQGWRPIWTPEIIQKMKDMGIYGNTDWMDELYKSFGLEHEHNISATGGTENVKYYVSLGLMNDKGIIPNTNFKRFNVRSNVDVKLANHLSLNMNLSAYRDEQHKPYYGLGPQDPWNPISAAIYELPNLATTYTDPDTGVTYPLGYRNGGTAIQNPNVLRDDSGFNDTRDWSFQGSGNLTYDFDAVKPLRGLKASVFVSYDYTTMNNRTFGQMYSLESFSLPNNTGDLVLNAPAIATSAGTNGIDIDTFSNQDQMSDSFMVRPQLSYEREFGKHAVSGLILYEQTKGWSDVMTGVKDGFYLPSPIDLDWAQQPNKSTPNPTGHYTDTGVASVAGRFTYAYDSKYLAEFSFREDGSYVFAPTNRWDFFPSVSLGWVMSEEKFFKRALPKIDFFKLKASYGVLGANTIDPYMDIQTYQNTAPKIGYVLGGGGSTAYYSSGYVYQGLKWEHHTTYNAGFDMSVWGGKLGVQFDWFYKIRSNILTSVSGTYAPSLGGNVPSYMNYDKIDYRGFELTLTHRNSFSSGWSYSVTGNLSYARNKVIANYHAEQTDRPSYQGVLGEPTGYLLGYKAIGLYQTQEQIDNSPTAPSGVKRLGDLMYADINGDGKIEQTQDFVKIGRSQIPEMNFSLIMNVTWKQLSLDAMFQGAALSDYYLSASYKDKDGNELNGTMDNTMFTRPFYENGNAPYYLVEGAWRPDHTNAEYPRLSTFANGNNAWPSSWWVKNGAYLRLKTLTLSYSVPAHCLANTGIGNVRVYFAATNLFTISAFKYVDPEMPSVNNGYYPQQRTFSIGANIAF